MKNKSILIILSAIALFGCNNGDSDLSTLINEYEKQSENSITAMEINFNREPISEPDETIPTETDDPEYFNDYIENSTFTRFVTINYNENDADVSGDTKSLTIKKDGAHVTIRSTKTTVCYLLTGKSDNGSLKIYSDHRFQINADGLSLTNPYGAAINSQSGKTMYFVTGNNGAELTDGAEYTRTTAGEDEKGTLFSEGQIVFSGSGKLTITSLSKNALASDDYVRFRTNTNVFLTSMAGHGIKANDGVFINGGVLNISVSGNGAKGINSEDNIFVSGGRTTIITEGATRILNNDTTSTAAIKCDSTMTISGGELQLLTKGDGSKGININADLNMSGGKLFIVNKGSNDAAKAKGMKVDGNCLISGGHLYIFCEQLNKTDVKGTFDIGLGYITRKETSKLFELVY